MSRATLRAAEEWLLPILMTAATAGLGLLPLALSLAAAESEVESPMVMVVPGALLTSTALNMVLLPTVYVQLDRRRRRKARETPRRSPLWYAIPPGGILRT